MPADAFHFPAGNALNTESNAVDTDILSLQRGTGRKETA
jgi:hypothetical protein